MVQVFDYRSGAFIDNFGTFGLTAGNHFYDPEDIVYNRDHDELYVSDRSNRRVQVFSASTFGANASPTRSITGVFSPFALAYNKKLEYLYVSLGDSGITAYARTATVSSSNVFAITISSFHCFGLAVNEGADLLYASSFTYSSQAQITVYSASTGGSVLATIGAFGAQASSGQSIYLNYPRGIHFDKYSNNLLVADEGNSRVQVINVANYNAAAHVRTITGYEGVRYVVFDPSSDQMVFSDSNSNFIHWYTSPMSSDPTSIRVIGGPGEDSLIGWVKGIAVNNRFVNLFLPHADRLSFFISYFTLSLSLTLSPSISPETNFALPTRMIAFFVALYSYNDIYSLNT